MNLLILNDAYVDIIDVNWCEELGTVLANEEVIGGLSERGGFPVVKKPMRQWVMRITDYADRLLEDLDDLEWPESIKLSQKNWIGKSEGAQIKFEVNKKLCRGFYYKTRYDLWCNIFSFSSDILDSNYNFNNKQKRN